MNISPTEEKKPVELKDILYCRDKNKWRCLDEVVNENEPDKSVDQVLKELKEDEEGQAEKDTIQQIIAIWQALLNKNKDVRNVSRYN